MNQSLEACLQPTPIIDSNHPEVAAYAAAKAEGAQSDLEAAIHTGGELLALWGMEKPDVAMYREAERRWGAAADR